VRDLRFAVAAAGLAAGLALGLLLPRSWLFVDPDAVHGASRATGEQYACPMFCVVMDRKPESGRCPVCGMELAAVARRNELGPGERRMVGLRAERLRRLPLRRTVRVVGEVDYDETRLSHVTARVSGWMEEVWADTTWTAVERGAKLTAIYAPELFAAQQELLASRADPVLRAAAERRLRLLGIDPREIEELVRDGEARESLVLRAPRDGLIIERNVLRGGAVRRGDLLYTVADLTRVWVQAEVFESDLVWVRTGLTVRLSVEGGADGVLGRVAFVDPVIDRDLRTARVRIEVANPAAEDGSRPLRIGQRVDAWIEGRLGADGRPFAVGDAPGGDPLAIPRSAVLGTGRRHVAYVLFTETAGKRDYEVDPDDLPPRVLYEMVELRLGPVALGPGPAGGDFYPVLEGSELDEGHVVVTDGNLLLDSQAQLSGRPSLLFPEGTHGVPTDPHGGH
jgi:Cu(I)/Ag(I) efflux system membrane fusion protein